MEHVCISVAKIKMWFKGLPADKKSVNGENIVLKFANEDVTVIVGEFPYTFDRTDLGLLGVLNKLRYAGMEVPENEEFLAPVLYATEETPVEEETVDPRTNEEIAEDIASRIVVEKTWKDHLPNVKIKIPKPAIYATVAAGIAITAYAIYVAFESGGDVLAEAGDAAVESLLG